jgi:predicted nuclease with RNAse H fold
MAHPFHTFIGIDLGGSRGKTTAVARLRWSPPGSKLGERSAAQNDSDGVGTAWVEEVSTRHRGGEPWCDGALVDYLSTLGPGVAVAIDAPLTLPACLRCQVARCPGYAACEVPATIWLRTVGERLQADSMVDDRDRVVAAPSSGPARSVGTSSGGPPMSRQRLTPYTHRCTEVMLHYTRDLVPRENLSQGVGPVSARAVHLRRVLAAHGFELNRNLLEVSPRSTVHALFGRRRSRGYKRDADPWNTRAQIIEDLGERVRFAPSSRLSKEEVLRNDHCFDALVSGYTAVLWAQGEWTLPDGADAEPFASDGWIWVPPEG